MTRTMDNFINQEIIHNANQLIEFISKSDNSDLQEELYSICQQEDFESAAKEYRWIELDSGEFEQDGNTVHADDWQELCYQENIEPFYNEALEFWIVSRWLGEKLEARGEMVAYEFLGFTIWGRTTSGQAISMDYVIQDIYKG